MSLARKETSSNAAVGFKQTKYCLTLLLDKAHFIHFVDDTTDPHLSKQQTWVQEQALCDSCTKSTSNSPRQTPAPCSDCSHKTTII